MTGMRGAQIERDPRTIPRVLDTFRPYRGRLAMVAAIVVVTSGLGVVNPLLIPQVFDRALFCP
jgi:ATP-binding cassette, subfamily B, bacterial